MLFRLKSMCQTGFGLAFGLCLASATAWGQFPQQSPSNDSVVPGTGGRPVANNGDIRMEVAPERPSPHMLLLLQTWEQKTAGIDTLQGSFRRYTYDSVFMTEKRAVGRYWFGSPDKARMDFQPDPEIAKALSTAPEGKLHHEFQGKTFSVEVDTARTWICTGKEILEVDHPQKQYSRMEIPQEYQGQRITDGPLPFLFGMKADSVSTRYKLVFGEKHDPQSQVHIVAYPLLPQLRREFQRAELLLDPKTYMPQAVKLWDPSGNVETVYLFYNPEPFTLLDKLKGPWSVSLVGWTKIQDIKADPAQLPMQERRESNFPLLRRTVGDDSRLKSQ